MISLAFWATVINYLDRQTLSVAAPVLRRGPSATSSPFTALSPAAAAAPTNVRRVKSEFGMEAAQILPNFATASFSDRNFSMKGSMLCSVLSRS